MTRFYLEEPSASRKYDALEYINEHKLYNAKINGTGGLNRCLKGMSYETWLDDVLNMRDSKYATSLGFVPGYTYFCIREEDNKIVGMVNIRYDLTEEMLKFVGHIGYGVRPSERQKGYAKIQLYLALQKAYELNLLDVMISCEESNIASDKTIKALGGVFERNEIKDDKILNIYWINTVKSLEKYKELYSK
ncbi:MAG: GNAT family N-acetyltransferase [Erysipelotrichales bacterium]|nr:GNAT family N-acetyltransferase [Erysipelotrichales bacterium]